MKDKSRVLTKKELVFFGMMAVVFVILACCYEYDKITENMSWVRPLAVIFENPRYKKY